MGGQLQRVRVPASRNTPTRSVSLSSSAPTALSGVPIALGHFAAALVIDGSWRSFNDKRQDPDGG